MEIWKNITDFDNYEVSSFGMVRNKKTQKLLSPGKNSRGYMYVNLYNKGRKNITVHNLVANTFLNKSNFNEIDHIDNNKQNNNVSNLRWCTRSDNCLNRDCVRTAKYISLRKDSNYFYVRIVRNKIVYSTSFKIYEDAVEWRDKTLSEIHAKNTNHIA